MSQAIIALTCDAVHAEIDRQVDCEQYARELQEAGLVEDCTNYHLYSILNEIAHHAGNVAQDEGAVKVRDALEAHIAELETKIDELERTNATNTLR